MVELTLKEALKVMDSGDCLLFKGRSLISRIIRIWSEFSHAAVVLRLNLGDTERIYMVEAVLPEVELRDVTKKLQGYEGEVYLFKPYGVTQEMNNCLNCWGLDVVACGIHYDLPSLFANLFGRVSSDAQLYFCSELVWDIWSRCGVVRKTERAPRPGDIPKWINGDLFKIREESDA